MANSIKFRRIFADFGTEVRDFERSPEILRVLTNFVSVLEQTIGAYIGGKFSSVWLHEGDEPGSKADLDLFFVNQEDGFIDIVLRVDGNPVDGGFLDPSETVEVTDEIVEGHRVIIGTDEAGAKTRYEVTGGRYFPEGPAAAKALISPVRAKLRRNIAKS